MPKRYCWVSTNLICSVIGIQHTNRFYLTAWNQSRHGTTVQRLSTTSETKFEETSVSHEAASQFQLHTDCKISQLNKSQFVQD